MVVRESGFEIGSFGVIIGFGAGGGETGAVKAMTGLLTIEARSSGAGLAVSSRSQLSPESISTQFIQSAATRKSEEVNYPLELVA